VPYPQLLSVCTEVAAPPRHKQSSLGPGWPCREGDPDLHQHLAPALRYRCQRGALEPRGLAGHEGAGWLLASVRLPCLSSSLEEKQTNSPILAGAQRGQAEAWGTLGAMGWSPCSALGLCLGVLGIAHGKAACGGGTQPVLVLGRPLAPAPVTQRRSCLALRSFDLDF